jgi:DnaK suppressor protein
MKSTLKTLKSDIESLANDEYMSVAQQAAFKRYLLADHAQTLSTMQSATQGLKEDNKGSDDADWSTGQEMLEENLREEDRCRFRLLEIAKALKNMKDDMYGFCVDSGEEIGLARLMANPVACRDIHHQDLYDRDKALNPQARSRAA